jgi:hypothetical protein
MASGCGSFGWLSLGWMFGWAWVVVVVAWVVVLVASLLGWVRVGLVACGVVSGRRRAPGAASSPVWRP